MADTVDDALHAQVKSIVDELEAAASGSLYEVDGDWKIIYDLDEWKKEQYAKKARKFLDEHPVSDLDTDCYDSYKEWQEDEIGTADDVDEPDEVSLYDYIEKQGLGDTRFEIDSSKDLLGGRTLFTYGGPNIWVHDDRVCGYWGSEQVEMCLDSDTRSALFSWFEEMWDAIK